MGNWQKQKPINLAIQKLALNKLFPDAESQIHRSELVWVGMLQPSPMSDCYKVRVLYKLNGSPDVKVLEPPLQPKNNQKAPHLYSGERLCLYLPQVGEWTKGMLLSETIIPWASEWLLNYEIWLVTGEWCGGGVHPTKNRRKKGKLRSKGKVSGTF